TATPARPASHRSEPRVLQRRVSAEGFYGADQLVLLGPVAGEMLVWLVHLVVEPPEHVDAEGEDRGQDPAGVVVGPFHLALIRRRQWLAEPGVDHRQLVLGAGFGLLVLDQVLVEQHEPNDFGDGPKNDG